MKGALNVAAGSKSARTKRRLYDVAMRLFREHGYTETSLANIAAEARVSTGTLYRYYSSKGDLLMQSRRYSLDRLHEQVESIPCDLPLSDRLCALAMADLHGLLADSSSTVPNLSLASLSETYASLSHLQLEYENRCELRMLYQRLIEEAQEAGEYDAAADAQTIATITVAIFFQELDCLLACPDYDFEASLSNKVRLLVDQAR